MVNEIEQNNMFNSERGNNSAKKHSNEMSLGYAHKLSKTICLIVKGAITLQKNIQMKCL